MGNRAVITTELGWRDPNHSLGLYVHWNGGRDSITAFLTYCKLHEYRSPESDSYGWANLATVISNFFGDGLSVDLGTVSALDTNNGDNGVYLIRNWEIVGRKYFRGREQDHHDLLEFVLQLDQDQPEKARLGETVIREKLAAMQVPDPDPETKALHKSVNAMLQALDDATDPILHA